MDTHTQLGNSCPVIACLQVIGGEWKPLILFFMSNRINRLGLLQHKISNANK
jgi:DNA-binding HxlR family transcriptional regulator